MPRLVSCGIKRRYSKIKRAAFANRPILPAFVGSPINKGLSEMSPFMHSNLERAHHSNSFRSPPVCASGGSFFGQDERLKRPPADIGAVEPFGPVDFSCRCIGAVARGA